MQVMNMYQPLMSGKTSGALIETNSSGKSGANGVFQSLLEASGGEQSEGDLDSLLKSILGEGSLLLDKIGNVESAEELGSLLEEILKQFDMEAIGEQLDAYPELKDTFPLLASLVDFSELKSNSKGKEEAAANWITSLNNQFNEWKETRAELAGATMQQIIFPMNELNPEDLKKEMQQALKEISELLQAFKANGKLDKADATKLTMLLNQWSLMMRQAHDTDINSHKLQTQMLDDEENDLWDKLLQRFEKRSFLAGKNMYAQNAKVTKQDVMNWLQQATENQAHHNLKPIHGVSSEQLAPMTKVEQHVIHLENTGKVERVESELMNKFSSVIRESQFISRSHKMELNLMLKPNHLGNINVKITQVNGEMMVKLLVSSQASKDMLEQNMHQLRHLFSPHQVAVERNETVTDDEFYFNDQEDHPDGEGQSTEENNEEQNDGEEDHQEDIDFETIFNQVSEEGES